MYEKEYHEEVNDYTKNISQGIFSQGLTKGQYVVNRRERDPYYRPITQVKKDTKFSRTQSDQLYIAPRPQTGRLDMLGQTNGKMDDVRR